MNLLSNAVMKVILLTGSTDGIGLETAKLLVAQGHHVLLHGRNPTKLEEVSSTLSSMEGSTGQVETFVADLSSMAQVNDLAKAVSDKHDRLDVIINNAGVFKMSTSNTCTVDGLDARFAVNTVAPYLLTKKLLPLMPQHGRVVNLSSAAQAPVNLHALVGKIPHPLSDSQAYAESKLAITMWTRHLAHNHPQTIVAVNPASFLGSKMVKEAYGVPGKDLGIGADILRQAALSKKFERASGRYFDNDSGDFRSPHPDAMNDAKNQRLVDTMEEWLTENGFN